MKFKAFFAQFLALNLLLPMNVVSIHAENNATNTNATLNETQKDDICTKGPNYEAKKKTVEDAETELTNANTAVTDAQKAYDALAAELSNANMSAADKQKALDEAQKTLDNANAKLTDAQNTLKAKQDALAQAQSNQSEAEAKYAAAKAEKDAADEAVKAANAVKKDAQTNLDSANKELTQAKQDKQDAANKLSAAEQAVKDAEEAAKKAQAEYDEACSKKTNSSYGFFQTLTGTDAKYAVTVLDEFQDPKRYLKDGGVEAGKTQFGEKGDATSFENMLIALDRLDRGNECRADSNCEPWKISASLMAIAQVEANMENYTLDHWQWTYGTSTGENASWGENPHRNQDPYYGWYTVEKAQSEFMAQYRQEHPNATDAEVIAAAKKAGKYSYASGGSTGHYNNIAWNDRNITGFGYSEKSDTRYKYCDVQNFNAEKYEMIDKTYTVAEYRTLLQNYIAQCNANKQAKLDALNAANTALENAKTDLARLQASSEGSAIANAQKKVDEAQKAYDSAKDAADKASAEAEAKAAEVTSQLGNVTAMKEAVKAAQAETDSAKAPVSSAQSEVDAAKAGLETAKSDKDAADKAVRDAQAKVDSAKNALDSKNQELEKAKDNLKQAQDELDSLPHSWNEGKVTKEPTCTEDGTKIYTCESCGKTKEETLSALGHDFNEEWTVDKKPTFVEEGSESRHCTRCDEVTDVRVIPILTFIDVDETTPHTDEVLWLAKTGVSEGWTEIDGTRTFKPYVEVARCDMAAFIRRLAKNNNWLDAATWTPSEADWNTFSDIDKNSPHAEDVLWLAHAEISQGWNVDNGQKEFRPLTIVARCDMAAFLHRLASKAGVSDASTWKPGEADWTFADIDAGSPHAEDVLWLAHSKVSQGWAEADGTKTFRPLTNVARCDMAAFLRRLVG